MKKRDVTIKLSAKVSNTVVGGGGRYWCLWQGAARTVSVFDASELKVVKEIALTDSNALIAAGMNKLMVVYPVNGSIFRYDLPDGRLEADGKIEIDGLVKCVCLGSASAGPLLLSFNKKNAPTAVGFVTFLDIDSFQETPPRFVTGSNHFIGMTSHYRASPDGRLYGVWATNQSPTGLNSIVATEDSVSIYRQQRRSNGRWSDPDEIRNLQW